MFLWDLQMSMAEFCAALTGTDTALRTWLLGRLLRETKPEDALAFLSPQEIADILSDVAPYLGRSKPFWYWLVDVWREAGRVR